MGVQKKAEAELQTMVPSGVYSKYLVARRRFDRDARLRQGRLRRERYAAARERARTGDASVGARAAAGGGGGRRFGESGGGDIKSLGKHHSLAPNA